MTLFAPLLLLVLAGATLLRVLTINDSCDNCQSLPSGSQGINQGRCITINLSHPDANGGAFHNMIENYLNAGEPAGAANRMWRHVNVVLIGHGSYSGPLLNYTGHPNLREVYLYQPYGTAINDAVVLGISTGDISLGERRFYRLPGEDRRFDRLPEFEIPQNWNRILPRSVRGGVQVPTVWLSPLESNHTGFTRFQQCMLTAIQKEDRILIAYTGDSGDPLPLWSLATYFAGVASQSRVSITVHWAACLTDNISLYDTFFGYINRASVEQYAVYKGVMCLEDKIVPGADVHDESFWASIRPFFSATCGANRPPHPTPPPTRPPHDELF